MNKSEKMEFQHNYGYAVPIEIKYWQWNSTFGTWSALVVFSDGLECYTYPKNIRFDDRQKKPEISL